MKVLVIIVTYNAMKWVTRCLNSTRISDTPVDVMVIDNGSTDGTVDYIRENFQDIHLVISETNLGFGLANNIGLQYVIDNNYDYAYLLNQDAWIFSDTIGNLIKINQRHENYGILSPLQLQTDGITLEPNFERGLMQTNKNCLKEIASNNYKDVYEVISVMAAHWLMSRKCIETIGGFSPTFPHRGEDTNYADRVIYHGMKSGVVPSAKSVHDMHNDNPSKRNIYNVYIRGLVKLSLVFNTIKHPLLEVIAGAIKGSLVYKSFSPISGLFQTFKDYKKIIQNREISKGLSAFLNIKK